jgi:hypothetical protein
MTRSSLQRITFCVVLLAAPACTTQKRHNASDNVAIKRQAADEIVRICALHGAEREAELKKLKEVSGMELDCSDP